MGYFEITCPEINKYPPPIVSAAINREPKNRIVRSYQRNLERRPMASLNRTIDPQHAAAIITSARTVAHVIVIYAALSALRDS